MTTPLTPAAQAVLDAVRKICPAPADEIAAAALRAAADQVIDGRCQNESEKRIYDRLHRIAAELEAQ